MIKIHFLSCWHWPDSHNILRVEGTKTRAPSPVLVGENQCDCGGQLASHPRVTNADAFQPGHAAFRSPSERYGHACARSCHQSAPCNSRPCGSSGSCSSPTRRRLSVGLVSSHSPARSSPCPSAVRPAPCGPIQGLKPPGVGLRRRSNATPARSPSVLPSMGAPGLSPGGCPCVPPVPVPSSSVRCS